MLDFGPVCYLDLQKTGSSFVVGFLNRHMALEPVQYKRHAPVHLDGSDAGGKFIFISVRDPIETYRSLYKFGCTNRGEVHKLVNRRRDDSNELYDGSAASFCKWLAIILRPDRAKLASLEYAKASPNTYGLLTHRFLRMSVTQPRKILPMWQSRQAVRQGYADHKLPLKIVRNETLNGDLEQLVQTELRPYLKDVDAALEELSDNKRRVNVTNSAQKLRIPLLLRWKIRRREWFLYENFY